MKGPNFSKSLLITVRLAIQKKIAGTDEFKSLKLSVPLEFVASAPNKEGVDPNFWKGGSKLEHLFAALLMKGHIHVQIFGDASSRA